MKLLTIKQTSQLLQLSRWTITEMLESAALPGIILREGKIKKVWRIREEDLVAWIAAKESATRQSIANNNAVLQRAAGESNGTARI